MAKRKACDLVREAQGASQDEAVVAAIAAAGIEAPLEVQCRPRGTHLQVPQLGIGVQAWQLRQPLEMRCQQSEGACGRGPIHRSIIDYSWMPVMY